MRQNLENRISMFYSVQEACNAHTATWTPLVPFSDAFTEMQGKLDRIEDNIEIQERPLEGIARDKREKKLAMVKKALEVAEAGYALATATGDPDLQEKMNYSRSNLLAGRDTVIGQRSQSVHTDASAVAAALVPYGIVAADLTTLQTLIDAYVAVVASPRTAITVRKGSTEAIATLVSETSGILNDRMDKLMPQFKAANPDFYQEYFDARIVVDLGGNEEEEAPPPGP